MLPNKIESKNRLISHLEYYEKLKCLNLYTLNLKIEVHLMIDDIEILCENIM